MKEVGRKKRNWSGTHGTNKKWGEEKKMSEIGHTSRDGDAVISSGIVTFNIPKFTKKEPIPASQL